ncbi:MAG TPA: anthranilate synthase component I [Phycisphaerae bacterium]|nr:anthranilate synthase component I [Phycisphaerae bacterium]
MSLPPVHTPTFEDFQRIATTPAGVNGSNGGGGVAIPVYRTLLGDHLTPVTAYERLARRSEYAFLLESVVGGERIARYSFVAAGPRTVIRAYGQEVTIEQHGSGGGRGAAVSKTFTASDPLKELENLLAPVQGVRVAGAGAGGATLPSFVGGAVGYAAYDTVRYLEPEKLAGMPRDDRKLPDLLFGIYDDLVIFDHVQKTVLVVANARIMPGDRRTYKEIYGEAVGRIGGMMDALESPMAFELASVDLSREGRPAYTSNFSKEEFEKAVLAAKEYIKSGDIFQVVLSQRLEAVTKARPFDIYRALRVINPSPFMFYLSSPECILAGSSPEIMCRVQDGVITNRPLAGTRKRGATEAEDKALEEDLLADPKERAEHIMLVDLGRNDVGRAAELGTVKVDNVMTVERYSHVMHIVSNVTGKLAKDKTAFDALRLALPVGTVSGAPKIRAMQIIDELEPTKRGPYAGAVGYIDYNRNVDTCIALRTMVITKLPVGSGQLAEGEGWKVYVQAGAGLVADSVPASEWQECINKASALLKAVALAEQAL